ACGTGRDLHLMHELGYWVCGSDVSAAMLARASSNLASCGVERSLLRADFRELPYADRAFDVVLCLATSLPHLPNEREVALALRSMWRVLESGGILVLSQGLTDKLLQQQPRFIPEINTPDLSRVFAIDYLEGRVCINVLDLVHEAERQELTVDSFEYLVLLPGQYECLLSDAGFSDVCMYDGFTQEPYDPESSDQLVIVARR
ncbi:MAG: class I SAM-dependent methyltransferase, partial [Gemmatimonadota bacterium]